MCHQIEPLATYHDRTSFCCGNDRLDQYIVRYVTQDVRRGITTAFVALDGERVVGYYTTSAGSVDWSSLPQSLARKLPPKYPVPVARIGRLAVDRSVQGQRLGERLLVDAFKRVIRASEEVMAVYAVIVDAKEGAVSFYEKYGFIHFRDQPSSLFLPIDTIRKANI